MSNPFFSKFDMIFTVKNNIKSLDNNKNNIFKIRKNKIYFMNNFINKNIDTTMIGVYKNKFVISTDDNSLLFGVKDNDNNLNTNGPYFIKSQNIDGESINLYKSQIEINITGIIKNTIFYVIDSNDKIYQMPLIYNELCKNQLCSNFKYQSYNKKVFAKEINLPIMSNLSNKINCSYSNVFRIRKLNYQQNLYTMMRLNPEKFPIISSVKNMNLSLPQQRAYSNMWWKQYGTSQSLPVNDVWGGFYLPGSDVPYTN